MNILDNFLSSTGSGVLQQLTTQFGIDGNQATSALSTLVPMLAGGLKEKLGGEGGSGLMDMVTGNSFQQFASDPASLASPFAIDQGKSLLGKLFGGDEGVSQLTNTAAEKTGLAGPLMKGLLPVVASLFMGYLSKSAAGNSSSATDMIASLAGADATGMLGALKGLASKVFG